MRTEGDSWDITSGVGSTALFVAAGRAFASREPDPLASDPFAETFVRAAGPEWEDLLDGLVADHPLTDPGFGTGFQLYLAARTRYFDAFCDAAIESGIRQVVILAAGLDARAYRLSWPDDAVVYELDRAPVLDFKAKALAAAGGMSRARRREVAVDLREDWPRALRDGGFDPSRPTAWLAEGLLPYLPAAAQDRLFESIDALSCRDSRAAVEQTEMLSPAALEEMQSYADQNDHGRAEWVQLIYNEPRNEAAAWFADHGWDAERTEVDAYIRALGRTPPTPDPSASLVTSLISLVTATRS
ncbi:SAM-dependent methyltransferase [Nocardia aurantia]|uniref:S-adenosyl-L-methionine-dependent methyltransferase n=1 Tax=Nocardia aurantia TaxID=2585199 RepID=A0A7K0DN33_9NOCA|nr:class I SAM-dependent methyltransferase [Nocardia aurantia]MQY26224.1 putative S-adenosyl-L-methionine-dependent methyltransferase [Nocardia aurantia]